MDHMTHYTAIHFPAGTDLPREVELAASVIGQNNTIYDEPFRCGRMPHPEVFMDGLAKDTGARNWSFHVSGWPHGLQSELTFPADR